MSPIAERWRSTSSRPSGLVRMSAVISFVGQKWISICFLLISWRIQCILISMCFILLWCSGFRRTLSADWLSTDKGDGPLILNPSSPSNERIQMTSDLSSSHWCWDIFSLSGWVGDCDLFLGWPADCTIYHFDQESGGRFPCVKAPGIVSITIGFK